MFSVGLDYAGYDFGRGTFTAKSKGQVILPQNPQKIRLDSDVAYDGTSVFIWILILILIALGAGTYEIAFIIAGLKRLGYERRTSRQE